MKRLRLFIDIGHGWGNRKVGLFDPGATWKGKLLGFIRNCQEYVFAKGLAYRLKAAFKGLPVDVYLNVGGDYRKRAAKADKWGADLLLSIHFNGNNVDGVETFVHHQASAASKKYQAEIHHRLVKALTPLRDRGRKRYGFAVLAGKCPAVLVETAGMNAKNLAVYEKAVGGVVTAIRDGVLAGAAIRTIPAAQVHVRTFKKVTIHCDAEDVAVYADLARQMGDAGRVEDTVAGSSKTWPGAALYTTVEIRR